VLKQQKLAKHGVLNDRKTKQECMQRMTRTERVLLLIPCTETFFGVLHGAMPQTWHSGPPVHSGTTDYTPPTSPQMLYAAALGSAFLLQTDLQRPDSCRSPGCCIRSQVPCHQQMSWGTNRLLNGFMCASCWTSPSINIAWHPTRWHTAS
jgi:hypothetical protein